VHTVNEHNNNIQAKRTMSSHPWRVTDAAWQASLAEVGTILSSVQPNHRSRCERVLRGLNQPGFSQAWQDWIMYRNFFAGQRQGVYVEVGSNDPIKLSNTAFFDLCLGWRGVCFEPQKTYHHDIREKRHCELVPRCVLGSPGPANFSRNGAFMRAAPGNRGEPRRQMECVGLAQELQRLKIGTAVDLLSIDIEGLEPDVLRCLPWNRIDIRLVLIETNKLPMPAVDSFFHYHGFANVATLLQGARRPGQDSTWLDNLYLKIPGGPLVVPSGLSEPCSEEDKDINKYCAPYASWERSTRRWQCEVAPVDGIRNTSMSMIGSDS
jgi:hypothetical protein